MCNTMAKAFASIYAESMARRYPAQKVEEHECFWFRQFTAVHCFGHRPFERWPFFCLQECSSTKIFSRIPLKPPKKMVGRGILLSCCQTIQNNLSLIIYIADCYSSGVLNRSKIDVLQEGLGSFCNTSCLNFAYSADFPPGYSLNPRKKMVSGGIFFSRRQSTQHG